jgi:hypothetical protein
MPRTLREEKIQISGHFLDRLGEMISFMEIISPVPEEEKGKSNLLKFIKANAS